MKSAMKFFRRSKSSQPKPPKKSPQDDWERSKYRPYNSNLNNYYHYAETAKAFVPWLELPASILERIFSFVCPHTQDESYETCEQSALVDACMLCDLRDLSHAGQVCKSWRVAAVKLMYHSIRIDSVHYCEREIDLSEKRKRTSRFDRNGVPEDTASARLHLLCRSLRDDPTRLGILVQYFKIPYMLRESKTSALARTIAVLPNLHYVDLPEGLYSDDPAYHTLRLEVQARCSHLRKMTYNSGSEHSLEALGMGNIWPNLKVLELCKIHMDPAILRHALAGLRCLRALKVSDCKVLDDDMFKYNDVLPAFPVLEELILIDTPRVTSDGLVAYLSSEETQKQLKVLSLSNTGVAPTTLHNVLSHAPSLKAVSITEQVDSAFPSYSGPVPPLVNWSLETLRFEITPSPATPPYASIIGGYYNYLASSLFAGGLPRLSAVYVRDQNFADSLLGLPPPMPGFAGDRQRPSSSSSAGMFNMGNSGSLSPLGTGSFGNAPPRFSSNNPFAAAVNPSHGGGTMSLNQPLEVFTKGEDDLDWGSIKVDPFDAYGRTDHTSRGHNRSSTVGRPLSSYGLADVGSGWQTGSGARKGSAVQGSTMGGFLAVPGEADKRGHGPKESATSSSAKEDLWPRPRSSYGSKRGDRDLWR
ncbi:hypothetical protein GGR53DRAFT_505966 [Hypoxylon sp. FL1150]|nr:hypothetical protein GGR53DRAFT_505966 [Hypoxylon sp. FL1150]